MEMQTLVTAVLATAIVSVSGQQVSDPPDIPKRINGAIELF